MTTPITPSAAAAIGSAAAGFSQGVRSAIPGADQLGDLQDQARAIRAWISNRHNWTRVAWFLSGAALFTIGAVMVGERPLSNGVTAVTKPVGRVVHSVS